MGIRDLFEKLSSESELDERLIPRHIAITVRGTSQYAELNNLSLTDANKVKFLHIKNVVKLASKAGVKILTVYLHDELKEDELDFLSHFCYELRDWDYLQEENIKISVLGKWFLLSSRVVEPLKDLINATKENKKFMLNLCINYDGQQELIDACKLISQKALMGKLDPQSISNNTIKEHLYTSNFSAPELIITTNNAKTTEGFLLWDGAKSKVFSSPVSWPDFGKQEFMNALEWYVKG